MLKTLDYLVADDLREDWRRIKIGLFDGYYTERVEVLNYREVETSG